MPRKKLLRRFEPSVGVSQSMLEMESRYVDREVEHYLRLSIHELRSTLGERQALAEQCEPVLHGLIASLPEPMQLTIRALLVRDVFHIAKLYETYLRSELAQSTAGPLPTPSQAVRADIPDSVLPFRETLFDL